MERQTLFVSLLLVTAGCLAQPGASDGDLSPTATQPPTQTTSTDTDIPTQTTATAPDTRGHTASTPTSWGTPPFPEWKPPEEPYRRLAFGNTTKGDPEPHVYTLWNHDDEARTIAIRIVRTHTTLHKKRHEFLARATLEITFSTPANYTLTVHVVGTDHSRTFTDPVISFDCNRKWTNVAVLEGGLVLAQTYQTKAGCT